jgi:hypothetical protein
MRFAEVVGEKATGICKGKRKGIYRKNPEYREAHVLRGMVSWGITAARQNRTTFSVEGEKNE